MNSTFVGLNQRITDQRRTGVKDFDRIIIFKLFASKVSTVKLTSIGS